MIRAREQNPSSNHLSHDATDGPNVHVLLVAHAQDDLGRPVIPRHYVRGHHERRARRSGQSKVQNFQRAIAPHHDIARF